MDKEKDKKSQDALEANSYSFMTNILADKNKRTKRLSVLNKFTSDPYVPYIRLLLGIGSAAIVSIICAWLLFHNTALLPYIGVQTVLLLLSSYGLIFLYMLPSRNKSMLYSSLAYITFKAVERFRRDGKAKSDLASFGIKEFYSDKNGLIVLSSGDYAYAYDIEGFLSRSILPAVADEAAASRRAYNKVRSATTHNKMITSIKEADVQQQLEALKDSWKRVELREDIGAAEKQWLQKQSEMIYYIIGKMSNEEYTASQIKFIIEEDGTENSLENAAQQWEMHADGSYARYRRITSRKELAHKLKRMVSLSKKGERMYAKENYEEERLTRK